MSDELPNGWALTKFDSVLCSITNGLNGKQNKDFIGIPVSRIETISNQYVDLNKIGFIEEYDTQKIEKYLLRHGDILFSHINSPIHLGKTAIVPADVELYHGVNLLRITLNEAMNERLFDYYCKYIRTKGDFSARAQHAVNQSSLNQKNLKTFDIFVPPLNEQIRIANKLDSLLAKVDAAQAHLEKIPTLLKRFRQSVLAAATSGELTREWREGNDYSTAAMLEGFVSPKKPARYKSRNTGYIEGVVATAVGKPDSQLVESWEWMPLVDIAVMGTGHTPSRSKPEYWGGDVCWIGIKDARNNHAGIIMETEQKINELGLANSAARILPENTVCISRTASIGYVVKMGKPMATSQDFVTWTPTEVLNPDWLKWLFVSEKESLFRFGKGSTHTTIYFPEWLSVHVALPPKKEQTEIVRRVESLFALASVVEEQYLEAKQRVDRLTQSLLAKAFRGELVPQDPNDEPASELLKRIQAEREALAAIKPVRKTRSKNTSKAKQKTKPMKLNDAPEQYLFELLTQLGGEAHADVLWKKSLLNIDDFYAKLKQEIKANNIVDDNSSPDPSLRRLKVSQAGKSQPV